MVVRPSVPYLAPLAAIGGAVAFVSVVVLRLPPRGLGTIAGLLMLWSAMPQMDRGRVHHVELEEDGDVVLVQGHETIRLAGAAIGGIGYAGDTVVGRLSVPYGAYEVNRLGRIVVVDAEGRILAALRGSWLMLADLERGAAFSGHRWLGCVGLEAVTFAPPPSPPRRDEPDEFEIAEALGAMRSQAWELLRLATFGVAAVWAAVLVLSRVGAPELVMDPLRLVVGLGTVAWSMVLLTQPLRSSPVRQARKILDDASWEAVDAVIVRGAPKDTAVRAVVCVDASGRPTDSWLVDPNATTRWVQEHQRRNCYLAVGLEGSEAVLINTDFTNVALLQKSTGILKSRAIHEWARRQLSEHWQVAPRP